MAQFLGNTVVDDSYIIITNVIDIKFKGDNNLVGSSSCTKVNGAPKKYEQRKVVPPSFCSAGCGSGPSSSNGRNGNGRQLGTASLILDDSESDDDSDDDIFEVNKTDDSEEDRFVYFFIEL